ncbi:MAG: response regulator, partial [Bacteroides sp.]|nr:response regulator [Bacteroides sp.]
KQEKGNLPSNRVLYIYEDAQKRIWAGTSVGIAELVDGKFVIRQNGHNAFIVMEHEGNVFFLSARGRIYQTQGDDSFGLVAQLSKNLSTARVYGSFRWQDDWMIFTDEGGFVFDMKTKQVSRRADLNVKNGLVVADNKGNYWVHNMTGRIWYVDIVKNKIRTFRLIPDEQMPYIDGERYHIVHDARDILWISTYGNGLFAYDLKTEELQHFKADVSGFSHINSNYLQYVMEDRTGGIWVSSEYTGISHLSVLNEGAVRIFPEDETLSDRANAVRMISKMDNGDIRIGTRQGGVYTYDAELKPKGGKQYFHSNIYVSLEDAEGRIWYGSRGKGVQVDGRWYTYDYNDSTTLGNDNIFGMCRDRKGRMWIATFGGGLNLAVKQEDGYVFRRFFNDNYSRRMVRVIEEDRNGRIWVGTSDGVYVFHPDSLITDSKNYVTCNYTNGKLKSNEIKCISEDSQGRMWVGTTGAGFAMCMPTDHYEDLTFEHYDTKNGLVNNMVQSIVEDRQGHLWIATEYGISRFNPSDRSFENFYFSTYALGNVYSENSGCMLDDGRLLFGSNHGLVVITPERIEGVSSTVPQVAFTDLKVNGISMHPGDVDSRLERALVYSDEVELKHFQNSFAIDFSIFDYSGGNETKYTYKLDNYDKEWSIPSALNFAAYKNLTPGTYKLRVKACNSAGVWGEQEAVLRIVVNPPFWKTTWAFLIYIILFSALLYVVYGLVRNFARLRNRIQVEKQLTEYKLVFFTNISHEFRTPLTLIQGALEKIQQSRRVPKDMTYSLKVMEKSTQRLLRLINQLLEFRKMQNNKLALSLEETDVMAFLYEIFLSFNDAAESKHMDFRFVPSVASYKMFIDKGNLDKVIYNLLSNAFKYTPSNGTITFTVTVDEENRKLVISVADTGVGIPKEKRDELFKRFMQSSFSGSSVGVGLHLTHELVNVHKGSIEYRENEGGGSVFTVTLPTDSSVYEEKDFLIPHNVLLEEENHKAGVLPEVDGAMPVLSVSLNKRKVLIIEDDNDVRDFLKEEIGHYFEVVAEADGPSGLARAKEYDADLIVCDVLMPGMTGFEVTRQLKNDFDTSHIPIILLTAMSSAESHLEGVESGADAYITKPFSPKLLLARAIKLIEQREKLREKFSNTTDMTRPAICTSDKDKQFADKLSDIMEREMSNVQLNVEVFAGIMKMGRTVFYRKVRGVTGYSPNEYIRIMRMKKAAEIMKEGEHTVAEVAYQVGFADPFYFSKCFKQQFGVSPLSFMNPS